MIMIYQTIEFLIQFIVVRIFLNYLKRYILNLFK